MSQTYDIDNTIWTVERWDDDSHTVLSYHRTEEAARAWREAYMSLHKTIYGSTYGRDFDVCKHVFTDEDAAATLVAKKVAYLSAKAALKEAEKGGRCAL